MIIERILPLASLVCCLIALLTSGIVATIAGALAILFAFIMVGIAVVFGIVRWHYDKFEETGE